MPLTVHLVIYGENSQDPALVKGIMDFVYEEKPFWKLELNVLGAVGVKIPLRIPAGDAALGILAGPTVLSKFRKLRCPKTVVYLNGPCDMTGVEMEELQIPREAAVHLRQRGYRSFVYFHAGDQPGSGETGAAFLEILPESAWFYEGKRLRREGVKWDIENQIKDLSDLLASLPHPIGVLCTDMEHGARVIRAAHLAGLEVPFQVGVVTMDQRVDMCSLLNPPLTQVKRASRQIGFEAAKLMDDLLNNRVPSGTRIPMPSPSVIVRASTSVWVSNSDLLDRMQQLLAERWEWNRNPNRIARELGVTRRTLDRHCEQAFGMTFSAQLERMRVEKTLLALRTGQEALSSIAIEMGYSSQSHMTSAFKIATGKTPGQFRKQLT